MPTLEVEKLTKRYGQRTALADVSFQLEAGECLALLGPNGAGKSTLIDVLATIKHPSSGVARVQGEDVQKAPLRVRSRLGVAFQSPIAHDHLTARELVVHHARLYAIRAAKARKRADELLAFVGLADRANDRISTFSEGMKRRADLARVLVTDPDVLLLDEPAAGLDPRGRRRIRDRLSDLRSQGKTLLVATHQMREIESLADRVAILHEGRVRALQTPASLREGLGEHVVDVTVDAGDQAGDIQALAGQLRELGLERLHPRGDGIEAILGPSDPTPGEIVDALERAGVGYGELSVRAPDLGDVFLDVTGRPLDEEDPAEVPA